MAIDIFGLENWFKGRPKWLQDAANRIIMKEKLDDNDYQQLMEICVAEAVGQQTVYNELPEGSLNLTDTSIPLWIKSVSDVTGINALSCTKPLVFGDKPLSIVYGRNGSGKSGYIRLLKHICSVRHAGPLHGNIFKKAQTPKTAQISYKLDGNECTADWSGQPIEDLNGIEIYDTHCGLSYIQDENEVSVEPPILRFFSILTATCTIIANHIDEKSARLTSKLPSSPPEFSETEAVRWYNGLNQNTNAEQIEQKCNWKNEDNKRLTELSKRLAEDNPSEKAKNIRRQKTNLADLETDLKRCHESFSDEKCLEFLYLKKDAQTKKKVAEEDAQKVFANAPLEGVGSESWQLLWDAAREYSNKAAYKGQSFPAILSGSRCVLCQSLLDKQAKQRLQSFEEFVKGELKQLAESAQNALSAKIRSLPAVPSKEQLELKLPAGGIDAPDAIEKLQGFRYQLQQRQECLLIAENLEDVSALPEIKLLNVIEQRAEALEKAAAQFDKDAAEQNREGLKKRSRELEAFKWIAQQKNAIKQETQRLLTLAVLRRARDLTSTRALSRQKSVLADSLITQAYVERFQNELDNFGATNIRVEIKKTRTEVGKVYHRMVLSQADDNINIRADEILSEGELRIVSLSAFLADTESHSSKTTFIFDDPISSLDHVFEEAVAKRLVELGKKRQVIVFTHRLSFVGYLQKYAKKEYVDNEIVALSKYKPGEVTDIPIDIKRTDKAINALLNERYAQLSKAFTEDESLYDTLAKAMCRDCRVLLERVVECDLLKEVVRRFSPEVQTKDKIMKLAQISESDCRIIDDYMTKFSKFEHSQPAEAPIPMPKPEEIQCDLQVIKELIERLRQR